MNKSSIRVLLLDDDPFFLKVLTRQLNNQGIDDLTACESGAAALAWLDQPNAPPDLIVCDLYMPEMNGVEFVRKLVDRGYLGSLILVSGEDERMLQTVEKLAKAHRVTVLGYLHKPFSAEDLALLLENWRQPVQGYVREHQKIYDGEALSRAISKGELINFYQPQIEVRSGKVVGVEALVRWCHPTDGVVFPDQFIGVAESFGLINDLTRVVMQNAMRQARHWQDAGLDLSVAINISMDNLRSVGFADMALDLLAESGMAPEKIVLEVTESRLMIDLLAPLENLTRLRLNRLRLSIDDFGTGHSSLTQLHLIPFSELKIDQSFVHGAWKDRTVRAIYDASLGLANQLRMEVVAEGVEDQQDWDFLRKTGCHLAQGYFIARPMPADDIQTWIEKNPPGTLRKAVKLLPASNTETTGNESQQFIKRILPQVPEVSSQKSFTHILDSSNGLHSNQIHAIARDRQSRLWMATPVGLACYDGSNTQHWNRENGLSCNGLRCVAVGANQTVWLGSDLGLELLSSTGQALRGIDASEWKYGMAQCLEVSGSHPLVGTAHGLVKLEMAKTGLTYQVTFTADIGFVNSIKRIGETRILVASSGQGLVETDGETWWKYPCEGLDGHQVSLIELGSRGELVIGTDDGLFLVDDVSKNVISCLTVAHVNPMVTAIAIGADRYWVAFGSMLFAFSIDQANPRIVEQYLVDSPVNDLQLDELGNLWIATNNRGLSMVSCLRFALQHVDVGCPGGIYTIKALRGDTYTIGGEQIFGTVTLTPGKLSTHLKSPAGLPETIVWDTLTDPSGVWVATQVGLFYAPNGGEFVQMFAQDPVLSAPNRVLMRRGDALFVGTLRGLACIRQGTLIHIVAGGKPLGYVYALYLDNESILWICTLGRGLWRENGEMHQVCDDVLSADGNTYALAINPDGRTIVLQDEKVVLIASDGATSLLTCLPPVAGWAACWLNANVIGIGASDGLRVIDLETGRIMRHIQPLFHVRDWEFTNNRTLVFDAQRHLLCGLNGGLVRVDWEQLGHFHPPLCKLADIIWNGVEPQTVAGTIQLHPGRWSFRLSAFSAWFVESAQVRYQFQLVGFEDGWSALQDRPEVMFSSLPPGEYCLMGRAYAPLTGFGPEVELLRLEVTSPWWLMAWATAITGVDYIYDRLVRNRARNEALWASNRMLEKAVADRTFQLAESERRTREIFDSASDAIVLLARDGFIECNSRTLEVFRAPDKATFLALGTADVSPIFQPDGRDSVSASAEHIERTRRAGSDRFEWALRRLDGQVFMAEVILSIFLYGGSRVVQATVRDITERKQIENALHRAHEAAEQASQSKSQFLANVSHEIRTPLNAVLGLSHLALTSPPLTAQQQRYLEQIHGSAKSLLTLINDLLDMSKIEAGMVEIEQRPFGLDTLFEKLTQLVQQSVEQKGLVFRVQWDSTVPHWIIGDSHRLHQVLLNLVSNAIKFTKHGEVVIQVSLAATLEPCLFFEVKDTGIGIEEHHRTNLFVPFTQADASITRNYGGTGLGLAISRELVELMGGEIDVDSVPMQGSTFWFTLPFTPTLEGRLEGNALSVRKWSTVILSDSPASSQLLVQALHPFLPNLSIQSFAQLTSDGLTQGSDKRTGLPDLIFIDWPELASDAKETLSSIRASYGSKPMSIILLVSPERLEEAQKMALSFVAIECLTLPLSSAMLLNALYEVTRSKQELMPAPDQIANWPQFPAGMCVLLVEDNSLNRMIATTLLERTGLRIVTAENGQLAVDAVLEGDTKFDAILMDLQMPVMDGLEATVKIREKLGSALPIIALSAHSLEAERIKCFDAGMTDYLPKPIEPKRLYDMLSRYLNSAQVVSLQSTDAPLQHTSSAVDLQVLSSLVGDDPVFIEELIQIFISTAVDSASALNAACEIGAMEEVSAIAHRFKSSARAIGALTLGNVCDELEQAASSGKIEAARQCWDNIEVEMLAVNKFFEERQQQL